MIPENRTAEIRKKSADEGIWDSWFRAIYPSVYYVLYRRTGGDAQLSEEVTQAALERFLRYQGRQKVETDSQSIAFLARTALRLLDDERLANKGTEELPAGKTLPSSDGRENVDDRLDLEQIAAAMPSEDRQLIEWVRRGHTVDEIAKKLGIKYSAAGMRIHRAKGWIRKIAMGV